MDYAKITTKAIERKFEIHIDDAERLVAALDIENEITPDAMGHWDDPFTSCVVGHTGWWAGWEAGGVVAVTNGDPFYLSWEELAGELGYADTTAGELIARNKLESSDQ